MIRLALPILSLVMVLSWCGPASFAAEASRAPVRVWPNSPPGDAETLPPEADTTNDQDRQVANRRVMRIGNVSTPTLKIFSPPAEKNTGAAIVICPGGGHRILAYDLEGTEVAEWLTSIGVTGVVLKYRVPGRDPQRRWYSGAQDAQRAISLLRERAAEWQLDPKRIGILGFSAGGEIAARTALATQRLYDRTDATDDVSPHPDFAVLVYPAYLADAKQARLFDDVVVTAATPPMFFVHAQDDNVTPLSSALLFVALKQQGISAELHIFAAGGHGYGLRATDQPVTGWPQLCEQWLSATGRLAAASR